MSLVSWFPCVSLQICFPETEMQSAVQLNKDTISSHTQIWEAAGEPAAKRAKAGEWFFLSIAY